MSRSRAGVLASLIGVAVFVTTFAQASAGGRIIAANGVRVVAPQGWQRVRAASPGPVTDPVTVLVVGTAGATPRPSRCQIAAYRIPRGGAVVVVVRWKSIASAGGAPWKPGRAPLLELRSVHRPSFECFAGRGAAADLLLGGHPYQVNVMVSDGATEGRVAAALAVARSFALAG